MTRLVLIYGFLVLPLWAQLDTGWRNLTETHDLAAARASFEAAKNSQDEVDAALAEIGWFLTHTADGPGEAIMKAGTEVIAKNPDSLASEFVLKWLYDDRQCLDGWVSAVSGLVDGKTITNPELKILYANMLRADSRHQEELPDLGTYSRWAGFATAWEISENFGAFPLPAFAAEWPPETPDYWVASASFSTPTGVVVPPSLAHGSGVFYAATSFTSPVAQNVLFRLFSYHNLALWVDGKQVLLQPGLEEKGSRVIFLEVPVTKGRHEVVLKTTQTNQSNGQFSLQITANQSLNLASTPEKPTIALKGRKPGKRVQVGLAARLNGKQGPLVAFCQAFLASYEKDIATQERLLSKLFMDYPASQLVGGELAEVYLGTVEYLPQEDQISRAFQILSDLNRADLVFAKNRLSLGVLLVRARQTKVSLDLLKDVVAHNPQYCDGLEALMAVAKNENLPDVRQQILAQFENLGPEHRWAQQQLLEEAARDGDLDKRRQLLENLNRLLPWEGYAADLREMDQDYLGAIEDLKKRAGIFPEQVYYPYAIARLYGQLGDHAAQREWFSKTLEIHPTNRQALLAMVNLDCFEGKLDSAMDRLRAHLAIEPGDAEFRQRLSHLEGRTAFEAFRVNTQEVIEEAKQKPPTTGADSELLLDQLMVRLFPDGSQMRYTHLVTRVLTKEGVDSESELQLPENLEILELRTIKADGTVLYPADIREKSSLSLTGVSVGDFIDEEHIEYLPPAYYDPDGLEASMNFIFQNVDRLYQHSELVLIYPEGLDPEPVLLSRNMPIEPEITTQDGLRIVRWLTKNLPPIRTEPAMPPQSYLHASASFYYNTSWEEIRDYYRNAIGQRLNLSYRLLDQLEAWKSEGLSQRKLVEKMYREVADKCEPGQSFYENINRVWETGQGNPTLLLAALYRKLGVQADVVLARPEQVQHFIFDTPMPEFSYALLRIKLNGETFWLDPGRQKLPFGYVPYEYRGARGIVVSEGEEVFATIPQFDPASERIETFYQLTFSEDGAVKGTGKETFFGSFAPQLAKKYEAMNRPETQQIVEAGMNETYPGAEVTKVTIPNDLALATFEVQTEFTHSGLGQFTPGERLALPFPMPRTPLLERFGTLPSRRTPVYIGSPSHNIATIELKAPKGFSWKTPSQKFEETSRFGSYELEFKHKDAQTLVVSRTYIVPNQFVEPADYPEFLEFCKKLVKNEGTVFEAFLQAR